jgi:hypothetical protein
MKLKEEKGDLISSFTTDLTSRLLQIFTCSNLGKPAKVTKDRNTSLKKLLHLSSSIHAPHCPFLTIHMCLISILGLLGIGSLVRFFIFFKNYDF